jgi:hypothetical protein
MRFFNKCPSIVYILFDKLFHNCYSSPEFDEMCCKKFKTNWSITCPRFDKGARKPLSGGIYGQIATTPNLLQEIFVRKRCHEAINRIHGCTRSEWGCS